MFHLKKKEYSLNIIININNIYGILNFKYMFIYNTQESKLKWNYFRP